LQLEIAQAPVPHVEVALESAQVTPQPAQFASVFSVCSQPFEVVASQLP
jgi:hypothetical protein